MENRGPWIQTSSGLQFYPLDPRAEDVRIEDIAHSLGMQCRFSGHCKAFYSVAQHSVIVSKICKPEHALWGLLHDASEAYLVDLPRPIKHHTPLGAFYEEYERKIMAVICEKFGLSIDMPEDVKEADNISLATEARDLMSATSKWMLTSKPMEEPLGATYSPKEATEAFFNRFNELYSSVDVKGLQAVGERIQDSLRQMNKIKNMTS